MRAHSDDLEEQVHHLQRKVDENQRKAAFAEVVLTRAHGDKAAWSGQLTVEGKLKLVSCGATCAEVCKFALCVHAQHVYGTR